MPSLSPAQVEKTTFLIVEDNYSVSRIIVDVLRASGAKRIYTAQNGRAAMAQIALRCPDVLITDWVMPNLDGIEITRRIRQAAIEPSRQIPNPKIPIIVLTGKNSILDISVARDAGVNEFVIKPFTPSTLLSRIDAVLNRPRPFVVNGRYIGPDRRRKIELDYCGRLKRESDVKTVAPGQRAPIRATLVSELDTIRSVLHDRKRMNREALKMTLRVLENTVYRARQIGDKTIQQGAEDVLRYLQSLDPMASDATRLEAFFESVSALCQIASSPSASKLTEPA